MHNDTESPYSLTLLDVDLHWQVVQLKGHEALAQPYRFEVEVVGVPLNEDLEQLLRQPAYLNLGGAGIHGMVHSATREHRGQRRIGHRFVIVPHLQDLDRAPCRRVFHQLDVPAILLRLLEENAIPVDSYRLELPQARYPARPFCIQFDESDLAFLQRLCEEEGIHYHFEHQPEGHVLVLADDSLSFAQHPLLLPFQREPQAAANAPVIRQLFQRHASPPPAMITPLLQPHREQLRRRTLERLRCRHRQIEGQSNQCEMSSGRIAQVSGHPLAHFNDQWLVTEVWHQVRQPLSQSRDRHGGYSNRFTAVPWATEFRPPLTQARPVIPGYQPARILGPVGQPAQRDELGRIKVRLWPDLPHGDDDDSGVWLPLAVAALEGQLEPAQGPVGGEEGLVSFLDSDPDRPVLCALSRPLVPRVPRPSRGDDRLLLDWLINR